MITELDPKTALVCIDLQKGIVARPTAHPSDRVVANARRLADAFRLKGLPVVLVHVAFSADGGDMLRPRAARTVSMDTQDPEWADFAPELGIVPSDILITKRQWNAFYGTELDLQLRRRGITGIVLCGISTSVGVESTARAAFELGYNQTFATDAMTDMSLSAHQNCVDGIFQRLGELGTTTEIVEVLAKR